MKRIQLVWPTFDKLAPIMQGFGENAAVYRRFGQKGHNGIDIGIVEGSGVLAMAAGTVRFAGDGALEPLMGASSGTCLLIVHEGFYTGYAHLSHCYVKDGDHVKAGAIIGLSGGRPGAPGSGQSTGEHLHAEVLKLPLKLDNGYLGRINPSPLFTAPPVIYWATPPTNKTPGGVL